ncbi:hypothetical protein [Coleofasciculus sp. G2-EDA-02]|uniref:hypothetical protein n=1 Tax=Coleofasciculus sp. G2-EDA-02 TaxID=3069529 RepID=UPI0032F38168
MDKEILKRRLLGEFTWKRLVRSLIFIYVFFALYVFFFADRMIFLPSPSSYPDTPDILKLTTAADETIPLSHGKRLFAAAPEPKLSLWVDGASHNDLFWVAGEQYGKTLQEFAQLIAKTQSPDK